MDKNDNEFKKEVEDLVGNLLDAFEHEAYREEPAGEAEPEAPEMSFEEILAHVAKTVSRSRLMGLIDGAVGDATKDEASERVASLVMSVFMQKFALVLMRRGGTKHAALAHQLNKIIKTTPEEFRTMLVLLVSIGMAIGGDPVPWHEATEELADDMGDAANMLGWQ